MEKFEEFWKENYAEIDTYQPAVMALAWKEMARKSWDAALDAASEVVGRHDMTGREWVKGSMWDTLASEGAGRIRMLKAQRN